MTHDFKKNNIERIVVRGTNWVGDAVMGVPALRELRQVFPQAHVSLVVRPWAEGLFADTTFVDSILVFDRRGVMSVIDQIRCWREQKFDLAVLFQNAFEAALIPFMAQIPIRVGYATDRRRLLLTHPLQLPEKREQEHEVFYYLNIIKELARIVGEPGPTVAPPDCSLQVSESRQIAAVEKLVSIGARQNNITVALCPGSINSRAKRWPAERYAELADRLIEMRDVDVLLIGSTDETDVAAEVKSRMRHQPIDLTGKTSLAEVVAILSVTDLVITNDTGPAHIASSLGRPTLVIFGPTNPNTTRPFAASGEIIRQPPDCAPCML
ncbi:MAG TPA: lipopolysaccharide heptosyltransferase II, partial [Pyrinomonadaceae bacterium]